MPSRNNKRTSREKSFARRKKSIANPEPDSREALAAHISAVMKHPLTPVDLYNSIADEVTTMSDDLDHDAPDHIARCLEAAAAKGSIAVG